MQQEYAFESAIVWFRRDLRVDDNPALVAALQAARTVVPLFIWAPEEEGQFQPGRTSRWWTKQSVHDLQAQLGALGSRLLLRRSAERCKGLMQAVQDVQAQAVFFNNLYDPISLVSDHEIKQALAAQGVECRSFNSDMLYEPWEVLDDENQPCTTFDDYWARATTKAAAPPLPLPPPPAALPPVDPSYPSLTLATVDWFMTKEQEAASDQLRFKWRPGVAGAAAKLQSFFEAKLPVFDSERAKVDRESTSELSPWIHIGSISVRYIFYLTKQHEAACAAAGVDASPSCSAFLRQMGYREYARYLAFFFPFIHERSLLAHLRNCPWRLDQAAFKAWRQGQTGYPLVDAAMKQLWSTGWAHNRLRVVAASFAVKNLLLPWQWGLKHFWDAQLDADLENDALGWQYISGGMADAHPFSFIMDLEAECARLDPDGEYVRRWLPALALLPTQFIHAPWTAPPEVLEAADVELGTNYPRPIVSIHESILGLQHAVDVLDAASAAAAVASSGGAATGTGTAGGMAGTGSAAPRHPYRMAHNACAAPAVAAAAAAPAGSLASAHAAPSVFAADPALGLFAVAGSREHGTPGTTEATNVHFNYASGSNSRDPNASLQNRVSGASSQPGWKGTLQHGSGGPSNATPSASHDNGPRGAAQAAEGPRGPRFFGEMKVEEVEEAGGGASAAGPGTTQPPFFDYPRYRQAHVGRKVHYIDVRLVPTEEVRAAAAAAAAAARGAASAALPQQPLKPIPGMRNEAEELAAMGKAAHDTDSAWAPEPRRRRANEGSGAAAPLPPDEDSESCGEDECMSEEVVSNTVGLSMPQASMLSGFGARKRAKHGAPTGGAPAAGAVSTLDLDGEDEGEADSRKPRARFHKPPHNGAAGAAAAKSVLRERGGSTAVGRRPEQEMSGGEGEGDDGAEGGGEVAGDEDMEEVEQPGASPGSRRVWVD